MSSTLAYLALHRRMAWAVIVAVSLVAGWGGGWMDLRLREQQIVSQLQTQARHSSIEITSTTANGNLMGSITLLGLIDTAIKQESAGGLLSQDADILGTLSAVGGSFGAEGVFVVGEDGVVKTSWDRVGKPSTGLDVLFRPYYRLAMQGKPSVYAAISMARGDRALYFTAPVFSERAKSRTGIGAVVARTDLSQVDTLLQQHRGVAMLLSPQGVVFASSRPQWQGLIDGAPNPQRLAAIRELKQFGKMFEEREPQPLPFSVHGGVQSVAGERFAVAMDDVDWSDPLGPWKLVLMTNLSDSIPWVQTAPLAGVSAALAFLLGWMGLRLVRGRHAQVQTNLQLQAYAEQQKTQAAYRLRLAQLSVQLQRCRSLAELAQVFLREARDLLGVAQGVLYVSDPNTPQVLQLAGSAACMQEPASILSLGEGLLGQCALERRPRTVTAPSDGTWDLRSGLGSVHPSTLMLAPLVVQDTLVGALGLALLGQADESAQGQWDEVISLLANSVEFLRRNPQSQPLSPGDSQSHEARP